LKTEELKIVIAGILFIVSIISGLILNRGGLPRKVIMFTIHKLASIAAVILVFIAYLNLQKIFETGNIGQGFVIASGILLLLAVVSGAWLSIDKQINRIILLTHKVTSLLAIICSAATTIILGVWN